MSNDKHVKFYKNKNRSLVDNYKPNIPQYQLEGIEPMEHSGSSFVAGFAKPNILPLDNPRSGKSVIGQPYMEPAPIKGAVPNIGNNIDHMWTAPSSIEDDLDDSQFINNNEFVSEAAFKLPEVMPKLDETKFQAKKIFYNTEPPKQNKEDLLSILEDLEENNYLLIVDSVPVCSGPLEEIQEQAMALVFGEHELCDENPIPVEDIIVLKRAKIKVGLFLE